MQLNAACEISSLHCQARSLWFVLSGFRREESNQANGAPQRPVNSQMFGVTGFDVRLLHDVFFAGLLAAMLLFTTSVALECEEQDNTGCDTT